VRFKFSVWCKGPLSQNADPIDVEESLGELHVSTVATVIVAQDITIGRLKGHAKNLLLS
jgi:hypothetical protein